MQLNENLNLLMADLNQQKSRFDQLDQQNIALQTRLDAMLEEHKISVSAQLSEANQSIATLDTKMLALNNDIIQVSKHCHELSVSSIKHQQRCLK